MKAKYALRAAVLVVLALVGGARAEDPRAEDLRAAMEADNTRWLAAFNANTPAALSAMYTTDAVVLPQGSQPVNGRQAIGQFWEDLLKPGNRQDHTFEIVSLRRSGAYVYQVARFTLNVINKTGEPTKLSGNTVRIFERQPGGTWLTKVHIFNRHQ
jgi:ketosteroid isomerase-like protein